MKIVVRKDFEEMSRAAAQILLGTMYQEKRVNISLTTGSTPVRVYEMAAPHIKENIDDFNHVHFYNFDNFELGKGGRGVTVDELKRQFLDPAGILDENLHELNYENYLDFDAMIQSNGGLDLMMIGLGGDGHFCANMPVAADFTKGTYMIKVKEDYPWYQGLVQAFGENIPSQIVTMGAVSVMKVRQLVMIVNGKSKAKAVKRLVDSETDHTFPSSILKLHPNFMLLLDQEAASLL